ncbi:NAD(+) kinase [Bowmanella sp. JS7-9]|uniref:NAD kinase n=1 Tax=Pseudobowmanella zhangzhouensis TaxID=1537679 RepID=A0ABW1XJF7_9ALTE|nr:NAD(+) kinase [Bowmanella sp. JS7-9]TBX27576.1 inorganic polyphosphate kinase [Bowmanella sp. JS7-9]
MTTFRTIGLIGKPDHPGANTSLKGILRYLKKRQCRILLEKNVAWKMDDDEVDITDLVSIGEQADLAIVVGGDGSMLGAARVLSRFNVAVVGVNRGNLGFLTDLDPDEFEPQLDAIFNGEYQIEQRFLIEAEVHRHGLLQSHNCAVNETVLHPGKVAQMMEFEVYVNDAFVYSQRSDGLIIATPTGSTAYSLSGGGPILTPNLDALVMVPMYPHTLSSRPIVIDANSEIRLKISSQNRDNLQVSCDGHEALSALPGDEVIIRKYAHKLSLLHPKNYSYFNVLRNKLRWGSKLY